MIATDHAIDPIGILDIGSNSLRLCVYDGAARVPIPLFNEKAVCGLARGLASSGRLNPEGAEAALAAVGRFVALSHAMEVSSLDVLATAAVRDAEDGPAFAAEIERRYGVRVTVLSGVEEARLAAKGVLCGTPDADGIVCDLGGGSLELVTVQGRHFGHHVTTPLGLLRLAEACAEDRPEGGRIVADHLSRLDWLPEGRGRTVYAVGGAWRALARICISQTQHPLSVLDNFSLETREALRIIDLVAGQSRKSLEKVRGVSKKRVPGLPLAAVVLDRILRAIQPARLTFSIYGMREGRFFQRMPESLRDQDPLLSVCRQIAHASSRFPEHGEELMAWMAPLFPAAPHHDRIRLAACLVSDTFWTEHPDYRAEQAFLRMLRLPFMGVSHADRAAIALTVFIRYQGDEEDPLVRRATALLDEAAQTRCRVAGTALRLAHTLSGGAPNLLRRTRLSVEDNRVVLDIPDGDPAFRIDPDRGFDRLARALGLDAVTFRRT